MAANITDLDLKLLGGKHLVIPPEFMYLTNYIKNESFISYYLAFKDLLEQYSLRMFAENYIGLTGDKLSETRISKLLTRIKILTESMDKAKAEFDLDLVEKIQSGNFKHEQK